AFFNSGEELLFIGDKRPQRIVDKPRLAEPGCRGQPLELAIEISLDASGNGNGFGHMVPIQNVNNVYSVLHTCPDGKQQRIGNAVKPVPQRARVRLGAAEGSSKKPSSLCSVRWAALPPPEARAPDLALQKSPSDCAIRPSRAHVLATTTVQQRPRRADVSSTPCRR